jgi:hypothetical protein
MEKLKKLLTQGFLDAVHAKIAPKVKQAKTTNTTA